MPYTQTVIVVGGEGDEDIRECLDTERVYAPDEIKAALERKENTLWVARELPSLGDFADVGRSRYRRDLLLLRPISETRRAILETMFDQIVAPGGAIQLLPEADLLDVLTADHPGDYVIGGVYDAKDEMLLLYRGHLKALTVPMSWFESNPGASPDPEEFEPIDCGQTVRLGEYEVGTDSILYAFDAEYRRRQKAKRRQLDDSFGGCLRRLRLMKGLNQNDFSSVTARTIRRIEAGQTQPHDSTVESIAAELGVEPDEITSY